MAATTMTKTQLVALMAEKIEITKKQAALFLETLAELGREGGQEERCFRGARSGSPEEGSAQGADRSQPADGRGHQD